MSNFCIVILTRSALTAAQKARVPFVVSKLDRLSRDVAFTAKLRTDRVNIVAIDAGKDAEPFRLHIKAAMAKRNDERSPTHEGRISGTQEAWSQARSS